MALIPNDKRIVPTTGTEGITFSSKFAEFNSSNSLAESPRSRPIYDWRIVGYYKTHKGLWNIANRVDVINQ